MSLCYPLLISRFSIFKFLCRRKPMSMSPRKSLLSYPMTMIERGKTWREAEACFCASRFSCGKCEEDVDGKKV